MQFTTFCGMKIDWNIFKFIIQFECIALFDCTKRRRKKWYPLTQISRSSCIQSSIHHTAICLPTIKTMGIHTSKLIHKNVRFCCDNRFELWLWSVLISIHLLLFWLNFCIECATIAPIDAICQTLSLLLRCEHAGIVWAEHTARKKTQNFNHWR